jgi:hypothetical protein
MPITIFPPLPATPAPAPVLAPNAAQEMNGQLERIAEFMELAVTELRVVSTLISQISQPVQDSPEDIRNDPSLLS